MGHCKTGKQAPSSRNRLEVLYCDVVQQLDQHLQLQSLRKTAKGWMRLRRSNISASDAVHSETSPNLLSTTLLPKHQCRHHRHNHRQPGLQQSSVSLECQAFPKYWSQSVVDIGSRRSARNYCKPSDSANGKVEGLGNERGNESRRSESPSQVTRSSNEIGRFRKSIETTTTNSSSSKPRTTVGCESLTRLSSYPSKKARAKRQSQLLKPIETECSSSSTFFQIRNNLQCNNTTEDDDPCPPLVHKPERRPANMMLRRQFNCTSLMEEVKTQRALSNARRRESGLNAILKRQAPVAIVILRSSNRTSISNESRTQVIRKDDRIQTFGHFGRCSENDEGCNGATRASDQNGSERPNARAMLESPVAQKCRPIATAGRTTAILQDALKALECAHRWNEWGARTLQELARASKAAAEQQKFLLDWAQLSEKPEILLPHDNDVTVCTRKGRVLECREEEREFIRDLIMVSGVTSGENSLLNARQHIVNRKTIRHRLIANSESISFEKSRNSKKKLVEKRILHDFVQELLRHELELRKCEQLETNLVHEHERQGQALIQRVWNHLQTCPIPATDDVCTTVGSILQRDLQSQGLELRVEMAEVTEELENMIYEDVMQEILKEMTTVKLK